MSFSFLEKIPVVYPEKCIGCKICELVCSSRDGESYKPKNSLIKILKNEEFNINVPVFSPQCTLCMRCANLCPTKAIEFVEIEKAALIRKSAKIPAIPALLIKA